jgi:hypothetical protein
MLYLQVEKVNWYPYINCNLDCIFDSRLSMFFLHVGIADIFKTIHTLNNVHTVAVCFGVLIHNCLIIFAFYQSLASSNSQE